MKQQLQQKLRELVTKHNPELLKLSFGCEVKIIPPSKYEKYDEIFYTKDGEYIPVGKTVIQNRDYGSRNATYRYDVGVANDGYHTYRQISIKKELWEKMVQDERINIIGHPIELRHLLIALDRKRAGLETRMRTKLGVFEICIDFNKEQIVEINIDIPLLDNEEEVLQDLIDILEKLDNLKK